MAPPTQKVTLTLVTDFVEQEYTSQGETRKKFRASAADGRSYTTFRKGLVDAYVKAGLKGQTVEYEIEPPRNPQYDPTLKSIPGHYDGPSSNWKPGGGGGGMTNRQAALLAAASFHGGNEKAVADSVLTTAEKWERWLAKDVAGGTGAGEHPKPSAAVSSSESALAPAGQVNGFNAAELEGLMEKAFAARPLLGQNWLKALLKKHGATEAKGLSPEVIDEASAELIAVIGEKE